MAAAPVRAFPAEAIPYLGIAVLITGTAFELYEACQNIRDLEWLYSELGLDEAPPEDALTAACDPQLLSATAVWKSVKGEADTWYGSVFGDGWPRNERSSERGRFRL